MADTVLSKLPAAAAVPAISATGGAEGQAMETPFQRRRAERAWADALGERETAVAYRDRFYAENEAGMSGPDHRYHEAIGDGLCERVNEADERLIELEAPDLPALAFKLAIAVGDKDACDLTDERREAIMRDVRELFPA